MELPDIPGHIFRFVQDLDSLRYAVLMNRIDIINPNGHPNTLVGGFSIFLAECPGVVSFSATTLTVETKK